MLSEGPAQPDGAPAPPVGDGVPSEPTLPGVEPPAEPDVGERRPLKWTNLYREAVERLGDRSTARWFVEDASGGSWPAVLDENVGARPGKAFLSMLDRREAGEPVQYVLGHWAFRKLDLMVNRNVLIPRPETEVVVDVALSELARLEAVSPVVVDLGTGSGAIALAIATEHSEVEAWATDVSAEALAVASANLAGLGVQAVGRVRLAQGSWWGALPSRLQGQVSLAVANPPYVAESELGELPLEVSAWEPQQALISGPSGLEAIEEIVSQAPPWLAPRAALVVEIAPHQAEAARPLRWAPASGKCWSGGTLQAVSGPWWPGRPMFRPAPKAQTGRAQTSGSTSATTGKRLPGCAPFLGIADRGVCRQATWQMFLEAALGCDADGDNGHLSPWRYASR